MAVIAAHIFHSVSPAYLLLHVGSSFRNIGIIFDEGKPARTKLGIHLTLFEEIFLHQCWEREIECHQPNIYKRCTTALENYRRQTETSTLLYFGFGFGFERYPNSFKYFGNTSKLDLLRKIADSRFCSNKTFKQGTEPWFLES